MSTRQTTSRAAAKFEVRNATAFARRAASVRSQERAQVGDAVKVGTKAGVVRFMGSTEVRFRRGGPCSELKC